MTRAERNAFVAPRATRRVAPAPRPDRTATLVSELRRITQLAEEAITRRAQLPATEREAWTIEVETDHGLVMLIQTIRLFFGRGGPGIDPPEYVLRAYDCPGEERNYHITLPEPPMSDGPFRGVNARQIADNHEGLGRLLARARKYGLMPDDDTTGAA